MNMQKLLWILLVAGSVSAQYTYLPPKVNIDSLLPPNTMIDTLKFKDFKSIPLDSGKLVSVYKDTMNLPAGILISDRNAALFTYYKNNSKYLEEKYNLVNKVFNVYYDGSKSAETVYQNRIVALEKDCKRSWLEKNSIYIGFLCGLATAILTEYAIYKVIN